MQMEICKYNIAKCKMHREIINRNVSLKAFALWGKALRVIKTSLNSIKGLDKSVFYIGVG